MYEIFVGNRAVSAKVPLVFALLECGVVKAGERIGIVGAGAAGVTAAAYAIARGCPVTIVEREREPLTLFANSSRPLYPRLFDWPDSGWDHVQAELPVMSWKSQPARDVATSLRQQWQGWQATYAFCDKEGHPFLEFITEATPLDIRSDHDTLVWRKAGRVEAREVAAILLMVGLGKERKPPGISWSEYWHTDELQLQRQQGRIFVSGNGDGSIQDLLNILVDDFTYSTLTDPRLGLAALAPSAIDIESRARFVAPSERSAFLTSNYRAIARRLPVLPIRSKITRVLMAGRSRSALDANAYALNRLLLARLLEQGAVEYRTGEHECQQVDTKYLVFGPGTPVERFDHVVVRHGLSLTLDAEFPDLAAKLSPAMKTWGELRLTRQPMWPPPVALAIAQSAHGRRNDLRPRAPRVLYADFLDPIIQTKALEALSGDRSRLINLYRGRLRFLSLLARRIIVNTQHFVDGLFFQSLSRGDIFAIAEDCRIEFVRRTLPELLRFDGAKGTTSWADAWLYEKWQRKRHFAKPYFFHSLSSRKALALFSMFDGLNSKGRVYSLDSLVEQLKLHGGTQIIETSKLLDEMFVMQRKGKAGQWSVRPPRHVGSRFHIRELFDPGWLWQELNGLERKFLRDHGREIIPARRPRQAFVAASGASRVRNSRGDATQLESWLYHSYHRSIAAEEGADAWDTIWTDACEWSRWGVPQHAEEEKADGVSFEALGAIVDKEWRRLRRELQSSIDNWYLGRMSFSQALGELTLGKQRSLTTSNQRISAWCTGDFEWRLRQVPPRCQMGPNAQSFIIYERSRNVRRLGSVMQFGS